MFGIFRLFKTLRIPNSTQNQYHFDPKLMIFGSRVFDPVEAKDRISREEFHSLRSQMIHTGGSHLSMAKCLMFLMFIVFPLSFLVFVARIILLIASVSIAHYLSIIMIVIILAPGIILGCLWAKCSRNTQIKIQPMLAEKNLNEYKPKGVVVEIAPSLKYMTITFQDNYGPAININHYNV